MHPLELVDLAAYTQLREQHRRAGRGVQGGVTRALRTLARRQHAHDVRVRPLYTRRVQLRRVLQRVMCRTGRHVAYWLRRWADWLDCRGGG